MKIKTTTGKSHISVNQRRDRDGNPVDGIVISQRQRYLLLSTDEWLELRAHADALIEAQKPRKRYRMA